MRRRVHNAKDRKTYGIVLFMVLWIVYANQRTSCPPTAGPLIALCVILFLVIAICLISMQSGHVSREEVWGKYSSNRSDMFKSLLIHTP